MLSHDDPQHVVEAEAQIQEHLSCSPCSLLSGAPARRFTCKVQNDLSSNCAPLHVCHLLRPIPRQEADGRLQRRAEHPHMQKENTDMQSTLTCRKKTKSQAFVTAFKPIDTARPQGRAGLPGQCTQVTAAVDLKLLNVLPPAHPLQKTAPFKVTRRRSVDSRCRWTLDAGTIVAGGFEQLDQKAVLCCLVAHPCQTANDGCSPLNSFFAPSPMLMTHAKFCPHTPMLAGCIHCVNDFL